MARPTHAAREGEPPVEKCSRCGHLETEHGTTGSRPCLAMKGDLLHREFCQCDAFHGKLGKAA